MDQEHNVVKEHVPEVCDTLTKTTVQKAWTYKLDTLRESYANQKCAASCVRRGGAVQHVPHLSKTITHLLLVPAVCHAYLFHQHPWY